MATATSKARATKQVDRGADAKSQSGLMQFRVFEDNGGDYHWTIDAADGQRLVRSAGFASYDDALGAARVVRDGAGSADMETSPTATAPAPTQTRTGRKPAAVSDELDAGRWLDDSSSSRSGAKAK